MSNSVRLPALLAITALLIVPGLIDSKSVAGEADVVDVRIDPESGGSFRFTVAVAHADEGWDHYADLWRVVAPDGTVLGERVLLHPHVNEQPFTRSLSGVSIPDGISEVTIEARDSTHQFGGKAITVPVPGR